jgi:hypothetical protein
MTWVIGRDAGRGPELPVIEPAPGLLSQVSSPGVNDINKFSYQVPLQFDAARSQPQSPGLPGELDRPLPRGVSSAGGRPAGRRTAE